MQDLPTRSVLCYDPETASSSGASHVPSQPLIIPSPRGVCSRDFGLPPDTRNIMGTSENVHESPPAQEGPSSALFENSSSCGLEPGNTGNIMEHGRRVRREPQSMSVPTPLFNQGLATLNPVSRTGGTYSHNGMMNCPRFPISEMHLGKFPDSLEFQSWKVNFKTEVCAKSALPHNTMHWIKEVDICI